MNDCKEAITIPDGCYATIEGNEVVFRKWAYPIPRALELAALHWRMNNCPSSPDTIGAFVSGAEWQRKQLIDKACEWLESNVEKYIYNDTPYPDADFKACVGGKCWEYFRKAMEI